MAELDYDSLGGADDDAQLPNFTQLLNIAGGIVSLALIAGLIWWGYNLTVRDISGVPVVRALEGPMRVAPEDPGGELGVHTGLAVNSIPAQGVADEPADTIALAPRTDALTDDDAPGMGTAPVAQDKAVAAPDVPAPEEASTTAALQAPEPEDASPIQAELGALIDNALAEATGTVSGPGDTPMVLVPADLGGLTQSPLPRARPETLAALPAQPMSIDGVATMDPQDIPPGTRLAQLGAFDSAEIAISEWADLTRKLPEFMTAHARVIEKAQSGGKTFYRLRAHGFDDLNDARRFCASLLAAEANCIPVLQR